MIPNSIFSKIGQDTILSEPSLEADSLERMTPNHPHPKYKGDQSVQASPLDLSFETPQESCFEGN